jgi:hypothetical protein
MLDKTHEKVETYYIIRFINTQRKLLVKILKFVTFILLLTFFGGCGKNSKINYIATVTELTGTVNYKNNADDSYRKVSKNEKLKNGSIIKTSNDGKANINIQKQLTDIEIETMHGVTAILGTRFLIETDSEKFVLIVDKGKVRFTRKYDGEKIELGSGQMIEFTARSSTTNKLEAKTIDPYTREKLFGGNSKLYLNF